jgi:formate hydrogenlyase transcriptional activator
MMPRRLYREICSRGAGNCGLAQMASRHIDFEISKSRRQSVLLEMADLLCHDNLAELLGGLGERLSSIVPFDLISISLHDPSRNVMQLRYWRGEALECLSHEVPIESSPSGWVWLNQLPFYAANVHEEKRPRCAHEGLCNTGIYSYCVLPLTLTSSRKALGGLGFGSLQANAYSEEDIVFLGQVAKLVASAVEGLLTRNGLREEKERLQMLLEVNATLVSSLNVQKLFPAISESIRTVTHHEFAAVALYEGATQSLRKYAVDAAACPDLFKAGDAYSVRDSSSGQVFLNGETRVFRNKELEDFQSPIIQKLLVHGVRSICCIPLISRNGKIGVMSFGSKDENAFIPQNVSLLKQVGAQVSIALDNARAYREIAELKDKLAEEKLYLQGEIRSALNFEEIIGESPALQRVLSNTRTVAPSDASVLILGETGTGKELIARAIHRISLRKEESFIKVNCAAIPTGLLESELFGHEKGAFTSAVSQKIGRLELAHKGTIFLDEVGEIPLELQPKLLRVLQDHEFERLGGTRTIRVDVRLISATNRDLEKSVAEKQFRSDLFYRLNVFPVRLPALRERRDDIPLLVRYFVQMYARRMNKPIEQIPTDTMNALINWEWPGNVRELENFIERSVILSPGTVLRAPLAELKQFTHEKTNGNTLESYERQYIVRALRECGGVISGINGAAIRLGLKRTTLQSMIQRMGISPEEYED